jgi:hypothetical protein
MNTATMGRASTHQRSPRSLARYTTTGARVMLGLVFFVFGLNGFLQFLPAPQEPQRALAFLGALVGTGYMFPLLKGTETLVGALLLSNRFVPLALTLIAPVIVNIVAFHAALAPSGLPLAIVVLGLELGLAWAYRETFRPMLAMRPASTEGT